MQSQPDQNLMRQKRRSLLLAALVCLLAAGPIELHGAWQAGVAQQKITPETQMWMAGYASRNQPASGKLTDLWAKALVLRDQGGNQVALITLDLIGIDRALSESICRQLQEKHGLRRDQIAICCSHTHTGPIVARNLRPMHFEMLSPADQRQTEQYASQLEAEIVNIVGQAMKDCSVVRVSWGSGQADFAVNRRNNPEPEVPQRRAAKQLVGPVDHAVPVLAVHDGARLKAVVFGYACHATVLSSYEWSGDYPGFAQIQLEDAIPGCTAMFWAGCGADQNPLPRRSVQLAKHYGSQLATSVLATLKGSMEDVKGDLSSTYAELDLPLDELPAKPQLRAEATSKNRYLAARARMLLKSIENGEPLSQTYPYPIGHWRLGDELTFVFLGGEVVVDFALRTKTLSPQAWIAGYSNDVMAYIPSKRVWHEGGYEAAGAMVYYGLPTRWHSSVEERIIAEIQRQLSASD